MAASRDDVTKRIRQQKVLLKKNWRDLADELNLSVEWTTAACLGQMQMTPEQAQVVGNYFQLKPDETIWLTTVPYRTGCADLRSDPIIHRFYEGLGLYAPALKEILHEDFGDGVMSAIDMSVKMEKVDGRVQITYNGKFLPYKKP